MIRFSGVIDGLAGLNLMGLRMALRDRGLARAYLSRCIRGYQEAMGQGLPGRDPIDCLYELNWAARPAAARLELPTCLSVEGGTQLSEWLYLAATTRVLQPRKIFEIGTYTGQTTAAFILNAPADATILSMDLPPDTVLDLPAREVYLGSDAALVGSRRLAAVVHDLHLEGRYEQVLCDSLQFDPRPHARSVELGFIDGAHSLLHVQNDTRKMAAMMADRGLVFWHDYGGRGSFGPLTRYLESLARKIPIYRVPETTLAWTLGQRLRELLAGGE